MSSFFAHINQHIAQACKTPLNTDQDLNNKLLVKKLLHAPQGTAITTSTRALIAEHYRIPESVNSAPPYSDIALNVGESFVVSVDDEGRVNIYVVAVTLDGGKERHGLGEHFENSFTKSVANARQGLLNAYKGVLYFDDTELISGSVAIKYLWGEKVGDHVKITGNSLEVSLAIAFISAIINTPPAGHIISSCGLDTVPGKLSAVGLVANKVSGIRIELPQISKLISKTGQSFENVPGIEIPGYDNFDKIIFQCFPILNTCAISIQLKLYLYLQISELSDKSIYVDIKAEGRITHTYLAHLNPTSFINSKFGDELGRETIFLNGRGPIFLYAFLSAEFKNHPNCVAVRVGNEYVTIFSRVENYKPGDSVNLPCGTEIDDRESAPQLQE